MTQGWTLLRLGRFKNGKEIFWDPKRLINSHVLLAGGSGSGKTYTIRKFAKTLANKGKKVYIFDVHGDIIVDGAETIRICETCPYGINPFEFSSKTDSPKRMAKRFVSMLGRTSYRLGPKQEYALTDMILRLYRNNCFDPEDPSTWSVKGECRGRKKRYPTMIDLERFISYWHKQITFGGGAEAFRALGEIEKRFKKLRTGLQKEEDIEPLIEEYLRACENYAHSLKNSNGTYVEEYLKSANKEAMSGILARISSLMDTGIFKKERIAFDKNSNIRRFDLSALGNDEQLIFIETMVGRLFEWVKGRGVVEEADIFVVIDEAKRFVYEGGVINLIFNESRKFGLGAIVASQDTSHFPDDIIRSAATKMLLSVDETNVASIARKLGVEQRALLSIVPKRTALVSLKGDEFSGKFYTMRIGG